jgi:hypothetical protein
MVMLHLLQTTYVMDAHRTYPLGSIVDSQHSNVMAVSVTPLLCQGYHQICGQASMISISFGGAIRWEWVLSFLLVA